MPLSDLTAETRYGINWKRAVKFSRQSKAVVLIVLGKLRLDKTLLSNRYRGSMPRMALSDALIIARKDIVLVCEQRDT
jgi:hypothetical protein